MMHKKEKSAGIFPADYLYVLQYISSTIGEKLLIMIGISMPMKRVENQKMCVTVYYLFPGAEAAYISAHTDEIDLSAITHKYGKHEMEIHLCMEGRIEQELMNEFFYLMPGDCMVAVQDQREKNFLLPLKHYEGICIGIDPEAAVRFSDYMRNDSLNPEKIVKRLCGKNHFMILRSVKSIKNIFHEMDQISEGCRADYLKIKVLELLFLLSHMIYSQIPQEECIVTRTQAELVKKIEAYILDNLHEKLPLKELTSKFGISDTYLQKSFQAVYGMPAASFIRMQKMQKAAWQLIHTERRIDEIAAEYGYINESKFSAAFQKMMGDSPSVYRKKHSKIKIL